MTAGLHNVTAKSAGGCISSATSVTINAAPSAPAAPTVAVTAQPTCVVGSGTISITAVAGLTYSVDGGAYSATTTYTGLTVGSHSVTAKNVAGCISTATSVTINAAPSAPVAPTVAVTAQPTCAVGSGSISITAVTGLTYSLDGGSYSATTTYTGLTVGSHSVTAKNVAGCISTATSVTINAAPSAPTAPVLTATQPTCTVGTGSIAITTVTGETYSLDGGAYSATATYTGLTVGSHSVMAKSSGGCISTATSVTINSAPSAPAAPTVAVTAQPTCALATGSINITPVSGNTYSIDGSAYVATLAYAGLATGTHTITAKNASGCISNATSIVINAQPATPTATISYPSAQYQATGTTAVTQTGQAGGTYSASPSGLSIDATTGAVNLGSSTPNQTYTITYAFSNGTCTNTTSTTIKINSTPATIGYGKPEYCATGSTDVLRTGPASGIYTVNGTGLKINSSTGTINLSSSTPGSYTVTYTYQDGSITAVATTSIVVNAMPIVSLNSDLGLDISKGDIAILTATGGVSYSWTGGDILSGQNTASLRVRPKQTTTYTVTATNASGCSEVMQITINVTDDLKLLPNNVVTPNGDGKNDTWVVKNIDYYPNNDVNIYDRAGRKVYGAKGYQNNWDGTYNGMPLAEGAYIYVIDLGKGIGLIRGTISIIRDNR
ncbi:gliding motility-associated C-terminal domain-containing protein [Pedobacter fastidiosus]|uniref:T9SS type B sorting domain-containing protein n=1 Tax=Pedobacter fastidiosus TaxID=2765361 RepID=UPI0036070B43